MAVIGFVGQIIMFGLQMYIMTETVKIPIVNTQAEILAHIEK